MQVLRNAALVVYDWATDTLPPLGKAIECVSAIPFFTAIPGPAEVVARAEAGILATTELELEALVPLAQARLMVKFGARSCSAASPQPLVASVVLAEKASVVQTDNLKVRRCQHVSCSILECMPVYPKLATITEPRQIWISRWKRCAGSDVLATGQ